MPNIFSAGRNALLDTLAQREATRMLGEDRARRDRLDEEGRLDRVKQRELQDRQITSLDEDRDARRALGEQAANDKAAEAKAKADERAARAAALDAYTTAIQAGDEKAARLAGAKLINLGGEMLPDSKPMVVGAGSTVYDQDSGKAIYTAPNRPTATPASEKDDPKLPIGTKRWIESISQQAPTIEEARSWLNKGWNETLKAHPRQELGKAVDYLDGLYSNEFGVKTPLGGAPAPGGRASGAGAAGGGAPQPPPAAPPAAAPGGDVPPAVQQALASEPEGTEAQQRDGTVWVKRGNAIVRK